MSASTVRASTAALAALGLAATAGHAAVVVTTPGLDLASGATVDVNGDAVNDFAFARSTNPQPLASNPSKTDYNGKLTLDAATASQFLAIVKDADGTQTTDFNSLGYIGNYAETLAPGTFVGPASNLISLADAAYDNRLLDSSGDGDGGAFSAATGELPPIGFSITGGVAYVGFKLGSNYGYLEFANINDDSFDLFGGDFNDAVLAGIAYETTPDTAILVAPIAVPEPASLAAVAGIAGVALTRRRARR